MKVEARRFVSRVRGGGEATFHVVARAGGGVYLVTEDPVDLGLASGPLGRAAVVVEDDPFGPGPVEEIELDDRLAELMEISDESPEEDAEEEAGGDDATEEDADGAESPDDEDDAGDDEASEEGDEGPSLSLPDVAALETFLATAPPDLDDAAEVAAAAHLDMSLTEPEKLESVTEEEWTRVLTSRAASQWVAGDVPDGGVAAALAALIREVNPHLESGDET